MRGRFLVLDGVDGCGKSTQARALCERLASVREKAPLHLREPGSTPAGERIREVVLDPELDLGAAAQALLLAAARRQTLEQLVRPALEAGRDVVCERFHASTFAYQGIAGDLGGELVLALLQTWAGDPAPDRVILLKMPLEHALSRRDGADRFESRDEAFQRRVSEGYRLYAERVPGTVVVDAGGEVGEVSERVWRVWQELEHAGL